ncbi:MULTISPECIES: type II toxin-antitoxin system VapB family antitoxin [Rhizobiaceae]|jgi:Arc/MetJ family transcription regulator|uniref:Arc/MetJ family transcription regulator n=1 Tax=Aliirhizobium cellulosilyticum TaxID=393664 RepID=A0A7W6Y0N4_9HYPH|nr:type II toxin-antitoxin system VapB family antitoxin [Rhizobium cellulosilyticum]MBB4348107.1 Arc/MetJ family transcription regulator [Rhizobium cellulosilyticum]MBB4411344.1 Arc/MetJ family transcription regulator [Rhizobium cellulosilyticum]MBB4446033.1 Arc/MetJ family transcription regulator [Rhizobium cellulosilyticum]
MRANIELDDDLIAEAMELGGLPTKKAAVDQARRDFVRIKRQLRAIDNLEGIGWECDLDASRENSVRYSSWGFQEGE